MAYSPNRLIACWLAGALSLGAATASAAQATAPATPDSKTLMQAIKEALAGSKLMTVDSIEMVESNFRTEVASYTDAEVTLKDIHRLELGGKPTSGSYENLYTFKLKDMVLDVPYRGFMNGVTITLTCAANANCVKNQDGQMFPTVTMYVNREVAAGVQKGFRILLERAGATPPAAKAPAAATTAPSGGETHEH